MIAMLIGTACFSYIVGNIMSLVADMDPEKRKFERALADVGSYMKAVTPCCAIGGCVVAHSH